MPEQCLLLQVNKLNLAELLCFLLFVLVLLFLLKDIDLADRLDEHI